MKTKNKHYSKKILENLKNTYCRIKPSKIEGVGVFAIRDIPKGKDPFCMVAKHAWRKIKTSELNGLDEEIKKMVSDFFSVDKKEFFYIPECGLNGIDVSFFLNTSKNPNIETKNGINFKTVKKIKKGEELTVSYASYDARYK